MGVSSGKITLSCRSQILFVKNTFCSPNMHRFWMQRRLSQGYGGGRLPRLSQQLTVLLAALHAVAAVSVMIVTGDQPWTAPGEPGRGE